MMKRYYADVMPNDRVRACLWSNGPDEGPHPEVFGEGALYPLDAPIDWSRSSDTCHLTWADGALEWVETAGLDVLKTRKSAEITRARLAADADYFVYGGKAIRTADKDMTDLLVADARISKGQGMPANWPGGWKAVDNTYVPIPDRATWDAFFIAMYDAGIANYRHSQDLKTELAEATTADEIIAINW